MSEKNFNIEQAQHYVYIVSLYMFAVGYLYFYSFFSAFNFNAIGFIGFVDVIKMATSGLFKIHPVVYVFSAASLIYMINKNNMDDIINLFNANRGVPLIPFLKVCLRARYKNYNFFIYQFIALIFLSGSFLGLIASFAFENYRVYTLACFGGTLLGVALSLNICFVFNFFLRLYNPSRKLFFRTLVVLYLLECGYMSYIAGHNDATRIIMGVEFTYKLDTKNQASMDNRFLWAFGNAIILWNKVNGTIIVSKKEDVTEYKYYHVMHSK